MQRIEKLQAARHRKKEKNGGVQAEYYLVLASPLHSDDNYRAYIYFKKAVINMVI